MDCAPLFIVNAEDLSEAMVWLSLAAVLAGWMGVLLGQFTAVFVQTTARIVNKRNARRPFSERAQRAEQMRRQSVAIWTRIAARNKREAARRAAHG